MPMKRNPFSWLTPREKAKLDLFIAEITGEDTNNKHNSNGKNED